MLVAGLRLDDAVVFATGLLVANVPEGLLPTITLALAIGMRRMAERGAMVQAAQAVETLGSTDVICTDKTGTLTENRMRLVRLWTARPGLRTRSGPAPAPATPRPGSRPRCSLATGGAPGEQASGDPTELAILEAAAAARSGREPRKPGARPRERVPFDPAP